MVAKVFGRSQEEDMQYTLPTQQQQREQENSAVLASMGFSAEQVEALRVMLGIPPKAQMRPPIGFDLNDPPAAVPPPGGWKTLPCIVHRLNARTNQPESKICRTAQDRDYALENGWHSKPQSVIEVDADPEVPQEELTAAYHQDRLARQKKSAQLVPDDDTADVATTGKKRGRPPLHRDDSDSVA